MRKTRDVWNIYSVCVCACLWVKQSLVKKDVDLHVSPEVNHWWEGGTENTKEVWHRTHTFSRVWVPSWSSAGQWLCWLGSCDLSSLPERKIHQAQQTVRLGPATVAVWPMTSSSRHSEGLYKREDLGLCVEGKRWRQVQAIEKVIRRRVVGFVDAEGIAHPKLQVD